MSLKETQEIEHLLWARWKSGDAKALPDLFKSFRPVENAWMGKVNTQNLPESTVRGEIKRIMFESFNTYNPGKGAKLSTYINSKLPKIYRYVNDRQNIGRIPEHRALKITAYRTAESELTQQLGRDPNAAELADSLKWGMKDVERMSSDLRKDLILTEAFQEFSFHEDSRKQQILQLIYYELDAREKKIFEWTTGFGGKKQKSTKEIAEALGVSVPTVGNIKSRIAKKVERYL